VNWDERYRQPSCTCGTEPNDFLASVVRQIRKEKISRLDIRVAVLLGF